MIVVPDRDPARFILTCTSVLHVTSVLPLPIGRPTARTSVRLAALALEAEVAAHWAAARGRACPTDRSRTERDRLASERQRFHADHVDARLQLACESDKFAGALESAPAFVN